MEQAFLTREERLKRRAKAKKVRKIISLVFICFVGIFVIILSVSALERLLNWNGIEVVTAKHGVLEETVQKKSVVVRKESVLTLPESGSIKYLVDEGSRVQSGAMLVKIESAEINRTSKDVNYKQYAPLAGTVFLKADGLESVLTPDSLETLNLNSVYAKVSKGTMEGQKETGQSAIRIVDNLSPAYLCFPSSDLSFMKGDSLLFRIPGSEDVFSGSLARSANKIMAARIVPVPNELMQSRLCTIEVIKRRAGGLVVPSSSLVKKNKASGVYGVFGSEMRWLEVEVKGVFGENAVVTGVKTGQEVVANPENL